jgi:hypothetical protein
LSGAHNYSIDKQDRAHVSIEFETIRRVSRADRR